MGISMVDSFQFARKKMVQEQLIPRGIVDSRVLAAMNTVPRHLFVDEALWAQAYGDHPLPISHGQTISQPFIVALMTQLLELTGNEKVLEIGTGSGYQTAILASLAKKVYSIERISVLLTRARRILDDLGFKNILLKLDDGTWGWNEYAPYDAIIVTASAPKVPQKLLDQLAVGGKLIIPVGDEYSQNLEKYTRKNDHFLKETLTGVRFVKLIGEHGWKE